MSQVECCRDPAVLDWYHLHRDDLAENWELARQRQPLNRIDPLEWPGVSTRYRRPSRPRPLRGDYIQRWPQPSCSCSVAQRRCSYSYSGPALMTAQSFDHERDSTFIGFRSTTLLGHLRRHNHSWGSINTLAINGFVLPKRSHETSPSPAQSMMLRSITITSTATLSTSPRHQERQNRVRVAIADHPPHTTSTNGERLRDVVLTFLVEPAL